MRLLAIFEFAESPRLSVPGLALYVGHATRYRCPTLTSGTKIKACRSRQRTYRLVFRLWAWCPPSTYTV